MAVIRGPPDAVEVVKPGPANFKLSAQFPHFSVETEKRERERRERGEREERESERGRERETRREGGRERERD